VATAEIVPQKPSIRITDFYRPWAHQSLWHSMPQKHRLHVGGFGSGKSRPLLMEGILHCIEFPGSTSIIMRKTMPDLRRTVIDKFENDVPKALYEFGSRERGTFNKSDHIVYFQPVKCDPETNRKLPKDTATGFVWRQSKLQFGACERIEEVGKYLSTEYLFIGFEELGEFPFLIYDAMEGRNRCTLPGAVPCMGAVTNPMGIGWGWIKKLWIDHKPVHGMDPEKYNPDDYGYIHSTVDQNPILIRDKRYVESLEKSPLRDKIRWGNLETVSGQYFDNWEEAHRVLPKSAFVFQKWQPLWASWDWGFGHFAVITFWCKAALKPRFGKEKERIVNVVIKEIVLERQSSEEQALALVAAHLRICADFFPPADSEREVSHSDWPLDNIHFSWERFIAHTKNQAGDEVSIALQVGDILSAAGLPRPIRSSTDRVAGWTRMYSLIESDEWFLLEGEAPNCVEAVPLLVRGDGVTTNIEDVIKPKGANLVDDCGDAMRYAVAGALLDAEEKPKEQKRREEIQSIKDPMTKFIKGFKHYNEDQAAQRNTSGGEKIQPSWMRRIKPNG
jgi:hypothetical protein